MTPQLIAEHDRLRDLADRLESYLEGDAPPQAPEFTQLRWMLVRELSMHLAVERRTIEEWCRRSKGGHAATDFALDEAFMDHVLMWSGATMLSDWSRYREDTRALFGRLRARMDDEEQRLFPQLR